jgi:hypothetical protein
MRIVLVGTDMAPVRAGAGALETLLAGWAAGLAAHHDVTVASVPGRRPAPAGDRYRTVTFDRPGELRALLAAIGPDAVVLNNRPSWQPLVTAPTLHLFHNWPDAWDVPAGRTAAEVVGAAGVAAVSTALAATVGATLDRPPGSVGVVRPFVGDELFAVAPRPEPGLVVSPNRLMVKKGVRELAALADHPGLRDRRILITDYLSPWTSPTTEHIELRRVVAASAAELIPAPPDRAAMAALYARADVVVCPSIRPEGLGLTAVEAQAAGVPVVSSGLGGLAEACLLPDLIADPTDGDAFAAAVDRAARVDAATRAGLRAAIRDRYSPTTSLTSLIEALSRARPAGRPVDGTPTGPASPGPTPLPRRRPGR